MEPPAPQSVAAAKSRLRAAVRSRWDGVDRDAVSAAVTERALQLRELRDARCVAAYVGMADEVDTAALIAALHERGVTVLLPVVTSDGSLEWRLDEPGAQRHRGARGSAEPPETAASAALESADVVVVPGLAFDRDGRRLGRGAGCFDRALRDLPDPVRRVALAADEAVVDRVPTEPHDERVHVLVTPSEVVVAGSGPAGLDGSVGPRLAVEPPEC